MNDLLYLTILAACCIATGALVVLCGRLMPHDQSSREGGKP